MTRCPNCDSLMNSEYDTCPECEHDGGYVNPAACTCQHCQREHGTEDDVPAFDIQITWGESILLTLIAIGVIWFTGMILWFVVMVCIKGVRLLL